MPLNKTVLIPVLDTPTHDRNRDCRVKVIIMEMKAEAVYKCKSIMFKKKESYTREKEEDMQSMLQRFFKYKKRKGH